MPGHTRSLLVALAALTGVRMMVAAVMPLSPDEAYYWVWSRALQPGYLDHPPMVALWVRIGTTLLGQSPLGVRLLAPVAAAAGSLLLADAGNRLLPRLGRLGTGTWAAILLNATLMLSTGAVTMTPDTPLLLFWTAALYAAARLVDAGAPGWWLAVGAAAGLGLESKYTAALLGLGLALWLMTPAMRPALRTPWPWAGGAVALVLSGPVVLWNRSHGWASFVKQGGRTGDWHPTLRYVGELLAGQAGLATPLVFVLMLLGTGAVVRRWRHPAEALCAAVVLPGALVFLQHAVGDRVQANWVAVLYPGAVLAAAGHWRTASYRAPAALLGGVLTTAVYLQAALAPIAMPRKLDPTLRLAGFPGLATAADDAANREHATFIAAEEYGVGAELAWSGVGRPVVAAEARWRFFELPAAPVGPTGLLVLSARRAGGPHPELWATQLPVGRIGRSRNGVLIEEYRLYRVTLRADAPAVLLPPHGQGRPKQGETGHPHEIRP